MTWGPTTILHIQNCEAKLSSKAKGGFWTDLQQQQQQQLLR
jgi:hypothetical protein